MHILLVVVDSVAFISYPERVHTFLLAPLVPAGRILLEGITGQNSVAGSVLYIDVKVLTLHGDYDIEIDLEGMCDAMFDGVGMRCFAHEPAADFRYCEQASDEEENYSPYSSRRRSGHVCRFGFG